MWWNRRTTRLSLTVTSTCADGLVTFESTGTAGGGSAKTQAVYEILPADPPAGADIYVHGSVHLASEVTAPPSSPLSLVVADGNFRCDGAVNGDIAVAGDFDTEGESDVAGRVWADDVDTSVCCLAIHGDVIAYGPDAATIDGSVDGRIWAAGSVRIGAGNHRIGDRRGRCRTRRRRSGERVRDATGRRGIRRRSPRRRRERRRHSAGAVSAWCHRLVRLHVPHVGLAGAHGHDGG